MFGRTKVGEQSGHLVKGPPANGLVVPATGEVVPDLLLVDPEEAMEGKDVGVADEGQAVIGRVEGLAV